MTGYDLIKWRRQTLVFYKIPQYIQIRDMLLKSKVGKLLRRKVRSEVFAHFSIAFKES